MTDFRSDRMESPEGKGIARRAWDAYASAVESSALAQTEIPADLQSGGYVRIVSAYLSADNYRARVRGMVQKDPLRRGPVEGHLHVTAFGRDGKVLARTDTVWSGRFEPHGGARPYETDLKVPRADVARLSVSWAPGAHKASEAFE